MPEEECAEYDADQIQQAVQCNGKDGIASERNPQRMQSLHIHNGELVIEAIHRRGTYGLEHCIKSRDSSDVETKNEQGHNDPRDPC